MTKIVVMIAMLSLFLGCSSKAADENIQPKIVLDSTIELTLKDQFENSHTLNASIKKIIFAFSKGSAHTCNDYFITQSPTYLSDKKTLFVADVSAAPSLIRSFFILPGLKKFKHTVLIFDDKKIASEYKHGLNDENIIIVSLVNKKITNIQTISSKEELISELEK